MEKVTIAIPVYNVEKYVERALLSALNQTYPNIEILAIDDKGSDNSMDVVRRVQKEHPKGDLIRIIEHEHNRGTGATRNTGIFEAQGEYLMYLDSDDEITPDCVEIHYKAAKEIDADVTLGHYKAIKDDIETIPNEIKNEGCSQILSAEEFKNFYFIKRGWFAVSPWNKLYKLSFLRDNNILCIDHHVNEDVLLTFQVVMNANRVSIFDDYTYLYYHYDSSTMGRFRAGKKCSRFIKQLYEIIEYKSSYKAIDKNSEYYNPIKTIACRRYIYTLFHLKSALSTEDKEVVAQTYDIIKRLIAEGGVSRYTRFRVHLITKYPRCFYSIFNAIRPLGYALKLK